MANAKTENKGFYRGYCAMVDCCSCGYLHWVQFDSRKLLEPLQVMTLANGKGTGRSLLPTLTIMDKRESQI